MCFAGRAWCSDAVNSAQLRRLATRTADAIQDTQNNYLYAETASHSHNAFMLIPYMYHRQSVKLHGYNSNLVFPVYPLTQVTRVLKRTASVKQLL